MRVRRHTAALIITSALFAAGVVAPADAKPGNGNANGHQKLHCRAFHASGEGVDDGSGTTTAVITHNAAIAAMHSRIGWRLTRRSVCHSESTPPASHRSTQRQ